MRMGNWTDVFCVQAASRHQSCIRVCGVERTRQRLPETVRHPARRRQRGRPVVHQAHKLRRARADEPHARVPAAENRAVSHGDAPDEAHHLPVQARPERVQHDGTARG